VPGLPTKQRTCMVCSREFAVKRVGKTQYSGTCPHCGTYDNGTSRARLATNAERKLCALDGHEFVTSGDREVCARCGHWEELRRTDSTSIGQAWAIVRSREENNED